MNSKLESVKNLKKILIKEGYEEKYLEEIFSKNEFIFVEFWNIIEENKFELNENNINFITKIFSIVVKTAIFNQTKK